MPGPAKTSAINTTGLNVGKQTGKDSRPTSTLPIQPPNTGDPNTDKYIDDLRKQVQALLNQVNDHENKLNHMQVDPITKVVTFIT